MTNRVFICSDTHFGHKNVIKFESEHRPFATIEDHDRELVARWNAAVKPNDTVWHLGDVFFGGNDAHAILGELNGRKKLVLGNHDGYQTEIYQRYFTRLYGAAELRGCILTHIPVHPYQLERRYRANIHGHLHSKSMADPRYVCVSMEHIGLAPALLDTIIHNLERKTA